MSRTVLGIAVAIALSAVGLADVTFHQGASKIDVILGQATFDDLQTRDPLQNYQEDGLTLDVDDFAFVFSPVGFPREWVPPYYPNAGVADLVNITRTMGKISRCSRCSCPTGSAARTSSYGCRPTSTTGWWRNLTWMSRAARASA